MRQLPRIIRRRPNVIHQIQINQESNPTREWFWDQCMLAAAVYGRVWNEVKWEIRSYMTPDMDDDDASLFSVSCVLPGEDGEPHAAGFDGEMMGDLIYVHATNSFRVKLVEYVPDIDDEVVLYDEPYTMRSA